MISLYIIIIKRRGANWIIKIYQVFYQMFLDLIWSIFKIYTATSTLICMIFWLLLTIDLRLLLLFEFTPFVMYAKT